ncbi:DNA methyltransferase [Xanthomonas translucens pv. undulosa]|nr:DNA methyltransferase [Xanthomonas translucens pv. undulosa]
MTSPAFRYHGAKFRLAPWVIQHFPPHRAYVESFGGAAGVLLQKPRAYAEVYNDLDGDVVNLFRVVRDAALRVQLEDQLAATPYAREEFDVAFEHTEDPVERARRLLIRAQMGFGSAGATKGKTGFRIDTKRAYGTAQSLWVRYPAVLAEVGERFAGVLIENRPAIEVMRQHDAPTTLHYVDPPYMHETRIMQAGKAGYYRHEMTESDHADLLATVIDLEGMVVLSGYPSPLYDRMLAGWAQHRTQARISAGRGTAMRTEVLWTNPACAASFGQQPLDLAVGQ